MKQELKPQENVEKYIIQPSVHQYLGIKVKKDTYIVDRTKNDYGTVTQIIKDCTLTTKIKRKSNNFGVESKEKSELVQKIQEGTVLIWQEGTGYIIPECNVCTVKEAIESLKVIEDL